MANQDHFLKIGQMVGSYRVNRFIGRGGMGEVYEAEDNTLSRPVALKVLLPSLMSDETFVKRFLAEGKSLARINHRNVVTVYSLGVSEGIYFMAMELIDGKTLDEIIIESRMPYKQVYTYLRQILSGVAALHANNIIHRDLKPKNMIVNASGVLKIVDFGIAKMKFGEQELTTLTPGSVIGSISYLAPELLRSGGLASERSDLWSVGIILYEMLYGEKLFAGASPLEIMESIRSKTISHPFGRRLTTPKFLIELIDRLLEKSVENRPASAKALLAELASTPEQIIAEPALPPTPLSIESVNFENSAAPVRSSSRFDELTVAVPNKKLETSKPVTIPPKPQNRRYSAIWAGVMCALALVLFNKLKKTGEPLRQPAAESAPVISEPQRAEAPPPLEMSAAPVTSPQLETTTQSPPLPVTESSAPATTTATPILAKATPKKKQTKTKTRTVVRRTHAAPAKPVVVNTPKKKAPQVETAKPVVHEVAREVANVPPTARLKSPVPNLPQEGIAVVAMDAKPVPVVFKWESTDGADAYQLELSPAKNFSKVIFTQKTHETQLVVTTALPIGNIYWRVRAKKEKSISPWSAPASFEVTKP